MPLSPAGTVPRSERGTGRTRAPRSRGRAGRGAGQKLRAAPSRPRAPVRERSAAAGPGLEGATERPAPRRAPRVRARGDGRCPPRDSPGAGGRRVRAGGGGGMCAAGGSRGGSRGRCRSGTSDGTARRSPSATRGRRGRFRRPDLSAAPGAAGTGHGAGPHELRGRGATAPPVPPRSDLRRARLPPWELRRCFKARGRELPEGARGRGPARGPRCGDGAAPPAHSPLPRGQSEAAEGRTPAEALPGRSARHVLRRVVKLLAFIRQG